MANKAKVWAGRLTRARAADQRDFDGMLSEHELFATADAICAAQATYADGDELERLYVFSDGSAFLDSRYSGIRHFAGKRQREAAFRIAMAGAMDGEARWDALGALLGGKPARALAILDAAAAKALGLAG